VFKQSDRWVRVQLAYLWTNGVSRVTYSSFLRSFPSSTTLWRSSIFSYNHSLGISILRCLLMNLCRSFCSARLYGPNLFRSFRSLTPMSNITNGDLNNTQAERARDDISIDPAYRFQSFAISQSEDDPAIRERYRPFLLKDDISSDDWIAKLELSTALKMVETHGLNSNDKRLRVLVLHGSMRSRWGHLTSRATLVSKLTPRRSYSRLLSYEASRILFRLGCDVRMYDPSGLPMKDDVQHSHPKVQELRDLSKWSDGHIWISPEQHGNLVSDLPRLVAGVGSRFLTMGLRLQFSRTKSTGYPSQRGLFVQPKGAH
jgi:hypothetical protein